MGKNPVTLSILCLLFATIKGYSQAEAEVSVHSVDYIDKVVHIYYEIGGSNEADLFSVNLLILDSLGKALDARALMGDVGEHVKGGETRHITWDPVEDNIYVDAKISIEVHAYHMTLPGREEVHVSSSKDQNIQSYSRAGLMAQSLLIPGLGMTRITEKPHWLRAVAGYGCIAGSVYLSQEARKSYDAVPGVSDFEDKTELYDNSVRQDNISEVLAYAAIGVWVIDIIWTMAGTSDYRRKSSSGSYRGLSFYGGVDPLFIIPQVIFKYRF